MGKEEKDITEKKEKTSKKGNRAVQGVLGFLQHICLAVLAIAICIVVGGTMIRVEYYRGMLDYNLYAMRDHTNIYEDSDMFNTLFGFALSDIVRHGVVCSQLETNGQFDGRKIIDVTAYNYRSGGLPERYVTAEYYLEDLLKWSNYGFEWDSEQMTESQARKFLADTTRVIMIDPNSQYYNTSNASYLKSEIETYTFVSDVSANMLWTDVDDYDGFVEGYADGEVVVVEVSDDTDKISTYNFLVNRYKTVEHKNLEEYVSDWDLYYDLCHNVQNAANGLAYNYNEYLDCGEYYNINNSNVRYMIMKTVGDNVQIYTNLTDEPDYYKSVAESMISGEMSGSLIGHERDKYIYYSPADMVYRSNTSITENTVRQIFQSYDYAYPETVKIWFGVDSTYSVNDAFRQGADGFYGYAPYLWPGVATAAAAGILYMLIWIYLTCVTGKDADEEGKAYIRLSPFDEIPTEAALLIACGVVVLALGALLIVSEFTNIDPTDIVSVADEVFHYRGSMIIAAAVIFIADFLAMFFFYSLVRRIRAKVLWRNSYLKRAGSRVVQFGWKVYDNGDIVIRTWLPYVAFLLFNITMLLFAYIFADGSEGFRAVITLLFLAAVDILVGNLLYRNAKEQRGIVKGIETIAGGQLEHQVTTENLHGDNLTLANSVNSIGKGIKEAVEISMKDERMKADLITNVSHDIKTPLTSIINYVDLIKREQVDNEKIRGYIDVLDEKSQRLKQLTDDLVEASKISSGNISLQFEKINLTELMNQTLGEFSEKFEQKRLTTVLNINVQNAVIEADSRRIWRVIENLFNNIFKYAMEGTRVYLAVDSLPDKTGYIALSVKNISASPLNCDPKELTERFIRGDESRTTEGSGLGLSIAKNLTEAQKGTFEIQLDGDLFKVILTFPLA